VCGEAARNVKGEKVKGWNVTAWKSVPSGSENQPEQRGGRLLANQLIRAGEEQGAWGGGGVSEGGCFEACG
jgi:hypothetical protein